MEHAWHISSLQKKRTYESRFLIPSSTQDLGLRSPDAMIYHLRIWDCEPWIKDLPFPLTAWNCEFCILMNEFCNPSSELVVLWPRLRQIWCGQNYGDFGNYFPWMTILVIKYKINFLEKMSESYRVLKGQFCARMCCWLFLRLRRVWRMPTFIWDHRKPLSLFLVVLGHELEFCKIGHGALLTACHKLCQSF